MSKIAASILAANTMYMGDAVRKILDSGCDAIHFDVMDGVFVPNISFGPNLLRDMRQEFDAFFDVHLMLHDPLQYIDVFAASGADAITVHVESETFSQAMKKIRTRGLRAGASLKPETPASALLNIEEAPDQVLVMTVEPGFGGQELMPEMIQKIADIRKQGYKGVIEADGGINTDNAKRLANAGVDVLVLGTTFFESTDPKELVRWIHGLGK
ncbi:MAG: ribulose-phosphate 3-epimerase [Clostridiales bacterium]|nr:ribulose-phosphate 3-epimerase [Clostridiales bacterium]